MAIVEPLCLDYSLGLHVKEIVASITQRGQVSLPADVQRLLGLKPRGKVVFRIDGEDVRLVSPRMTLEEAYGSVPPLAQPEDFSAISRQVKEAKARETVDELRKA
jgi:bifunctional DNA-binding transcriptional regulator/antitoxin component of YhaV-PrlF toxin-antitoxin module